MNFIIIKLLFKEFYTYECETTIVGFVLKM